MSGLPVPPLHGQWSDGTMDAIAAVEAQLTGDHTGLAVILANCDHTDVAAAALKLLAELVDAGDAGLTACSCHFREFALVAIRQP